MAGKKKGGNPAKGEKIFKNLCTVCHALSVSPLINFLAVQNGSNKLEQCFSPNMLTFRFVGTWYWTISCWCCRN